MSPEDTDRELRALRDLYYGLSKEMAVVQGEVKNVVKEQEKTNKILSWVGMVMGGSFLLALANLVFKVGAT